jgi:hypothetical protein
MACLSPLIMSVCDFSFLTKRYADENGVITRDWFRIKRFQDNGWKINPDTLMGYRISTQNSRQFVLEDIPSYVHMQDIEVPCGNCLQCRLKYSKDWAIRCSMEASQYRCNYFVTLTYDDDHIVKGSLDNPTLVRKHVQQFLKSLRWKFKHELGFTGIRYFGCGEYGDETNRPHYHLILFNCPIPDLTIDFIDSEGCISRHKNSAGQFMYYSQFIKDVWSYGNITVDDCNYRTEAYVSRYILKKQKGASSSVYKKQLGILPPFVCMSLKPGIGDNFYDQIDKENPTIILPRPDNKPLVSGLPRFYTKKIKTDDPEYYAQLQDKATQNVLAMRSLLKGHQLINDNRAAKEDHITRTMEEFKRDF